MKLTIASAVLAIGVLISANGNAQAPTGSTGECKDGTYSSAPSKRGACAGHKGVKDWYNTATPAKEPGSAAVPAPSAPTAPTAAPAKNSSVATVAPAAGGGAGQVWVNTKSKVYHCSGTKWYGKTKVGEYMTESAAKAAGSHADHGKACS